MKILVVDCSDFRSFPIGGTLSFLKVFLKEIQAEIHVDLLGITRDRQSFPGKWMELATGERSFRFMPVVCIPADAMSLRPFLPMRAQFLLGLYRYGRRVPEDYDLIYGHSGEYLLPFIFPHRHQARIVLHVHGVPYGAATGSRYGFVRNSLCTRLYRTLIDRVLAESERVIWVSHEGMHRHSSDSELMQKSSVIPNPIDTNAFHPMDPLESRITLRLPLQQSIILYVGRLNRAKGLDLLLHALQHIAEAYPDVLLLLAGEGEELPHLQALARQLGIESHVQFLGSVEHAMLPRLMSAADVGAFSSLHEGFPIAVAECLACGLPVVATRVGDLDKLIIDGKNGFLVESRDCEEFGVKLLQALSNSKSMKIAAYDHSREYASTEIMSHLQETLCKATDSPQHKSLR